jgi:hypothetical protein
MMSAACRYERVSAAARVVVFWIDAAATNARGTSTQDYRCARQKMMLLHGGSSSE